MGPLLRQLVLEALTQPKIAARRLMGISLPSDILFQMALLTAILFTLIWAPNLTVLNTFSVETGGAEIPRLAPILAAALKLAEIYFGAFCIQKFGEMFGGKGTFQQALKVAIFLTFVSTLWLILVWLSAVLMPVAMILVVLAFVYWTFWALASFVAVLHGFESVANTLVGVILFGMLASLILLMVSEIILNATGLTPMGAQ